MSTGEVVTCRFAGWLGNGSDAQGPGSLTVSCAGVTKTKILHLVKVQKWMFKQLTITLWHESASNRIDQHQSMHHRV